MAVRKPTASAVADPPADEFSAITPPDLGGNGGGSAGPVTTQQPVMPLAVPTGTADLIDPDAKRGTHFTGPVMSGGAGEGIYGIAPLIKRARFTFSNGSFSIPVKFPSSSILLVCYTMIEQSFNGTTPTVKLETTQGGSILIGPQDLTVAPALVTAPFTGLLTSSWQIFLTVSAAGATQGKATLMISYSVPGKAVWS